MKHFLRFQPHRLILWTSFCALCGTLQAQTPTLSVSPLSITNDFVGKIVLTISNLNSGQKVIVQKYLDLNANGGIDFGQDMLVRSFAVTDGSLPLVGGVRNINVSGDEDGATNGQIRVELNYPGLNETLEHIAGHYLFRVLDANGVFAPLVVPFSVVQKAYPQGVSGQAIAAATGLPLTNAVVVLAPQNGNNGVGTIADVNGNFALSSPAGNYALLALPAGCVADPSAGGGIGATSIIIKR